MGIGLVGEIGIRIGKFIWKIYLGTGNKFYSTMNKQGLEEMRRKNKEKFKTLERVKLDNFYANFLLLQVSP